MNAEKEPAAQSVHAAAPATEYFPAAQAAHFDMPVLAANVPAAQFCASELHNQTSITCLLATASLVPCIGLQLWTQHHGCTSPQDTLRKRRWMWTRCWGCTCQPDTPCTQQLTWSQFYHYRCR